MKANEFVKKFGWDEAKELIVKHEKCYMPDVFDMWSDELQDFVLATKHASFDMIDLKRLVESHELVESKGGLIKAKEILADNPVWCSGSKRYSSPLERAIADVESCMEVSSESN